MRALAALLLAAAPAAACPPLATEAEVAALLDGPAECRTGLAQGGGRFVNCGWTFPYRDAGARTAFEAVAARLAPCGPGLPKRSDVGVNHPDSYASHTVALPSGTVTVALKDKAPLSRSLVFVTLTAE